MHSSDGSTTGQMDCCDCTPQLPPQEGCEAKMAGQAVYCAYQLHVLVQGF